MMVQDNADLIKQWQTFKQRYRWSLVSDESAFIAGMTSDLHRVRAAATTGRDPIVRIIWRAYNCIMYHAVWQGLRKPPQVAILDRCNQACHEIQQLVIRFARGRGYDDQDAADVAQEVLLKLISCPEAIHERHSMTAWIVDTSRDKIGSLLRRTNRTVPLDDSIPIADAQMIAVDDVVEASIADDELYQHMKALLSDFQCQVVILAALQGLKPRHIAPILKTNADRVSVELGRAKAKLSDPKAQQALFDDPPPDTSV